LNLLLTYYLVLCFLSNRLTSPNSFDSALIDAGADPMAKNRYSKSPLDFARQIKDEALQRVLSATR
jgi:hypothetical protein